MVWGVDTFARSCTTLFVQELGKEIDAKLPAPLSIGGTERVGLKIVINLYLYI